MSSSFFEGIHVRIDIRIDIFISIRPMVTKFGRQGTSIELDPNETNQAGAGDAITSGSRQKLKTYLHYQSAYGHQTWPDGNLT